MFEALETQYSKHDVRSNMFDPSVHIDPASASPRTPTFHTAFEAAIQGVGVNK